MLDHATAPTVEFLVAAAIVLAVLWVVCRWLERLDIEGDEAW